MNAYNDFFPVTVTVRYVQTVWCSYMGGPRLSHSWFWANVHDTSIKKGGVESVWIKHQNSLNSREIEEHTDHEVGKSCSRFNYTTK